ncbi:MAG: hypothetical protein RIF46_02300, partial [Cyclobacteriaceae bacterium]
LGLLLLLTVLASSAQTPQEKIEAAKIALITERLSLTPEQAQKFWPIYNEFAKRQQEVRQAFAQARRNHDPKTASEEENKRILEMGMKAKEQTLQLEKQYSERLLEVINNRQLLSLRKAEDDFTQMIIKRLRDQQQRRDQVRDRMQNNQDNQKSRN